MTINPPASKAAWLALVVRLSLSRYVPRFAVISATEWQTGRDECLTRIQRKFSNVRIAVRSCKHNESAGTMGHAGRYCSFGPIDATHRGALIPAAHAVFASYGELHDADEVLIQVWVENAAAMLGVTSADSS